MRWSARATGLLSGFVCVKIVRCNKPRTYDVVDFVVGQSLTQPHASTTFQKRAAKPHPGHGVVDAPLSRGAENRGDVPSKPGSQVRVLNVGSFKPSARRRATFCSRTRHHAPPRHPTERRLSAADRKTTPTAQYAYPADLAVHRLAVHLMVTIARPALSRSFDDRRVRPPRPRCSGCRPYRCARARVLRDRPCIASTFATTR